MRAVAFKAAVAISSLVIAGCDSGASETATRQAPRILLESLEVEASGRPVVAEVNGAAVYADCVKRQAEAHQLSREDALSECIDFELLAQAADQPQYLELPEVQEEGKQELVRRFIESKYPVHSAADIPESMVREYWKFISPRRYNRPELRDIVFCRIPFPRGTRPDSEESKKAGQFLQGLYAELKKDNYVTKDELFGACYGDPESTGPRPYELAGIPELELKTFSPTPRSRYQKAFQTAVFDIEETHGRIVPPLFTEYGWDLIVITLVLPELVTTYADAEAELRKTLFEEPVYEERRESLFESWYAPFASRHKITRSFENLPAGGPALSSAPTPPPTGAQP